MTTMIESNPTSRDVMRFTNFVPMLEHRLNDGGDLFDLGPVGELQQRLRGILQTAREQSQDDRVARIQVLQDRLTAIEAEAVLRYGPEINDPSMELIVCMRLPPSSASSTSAIPIPSSSTSTTTFSSFPPSSASPRSSISSPSSSSSSSSSSSFSPTTSHSAALSEGSLECPICMDEFPASKTLGLFSCTHRYCATCFVQHFTTKIRTGEVSPSELACPDPSCGCCANSYELEAILPADVFEKYLDFLALQDVRADCDTCWCPNPQCGEAILATPSVDEVSCPLCCCVFCKRCQISPFHGEKSCEEARRLREDSAETERGFVFWMQAQGAKVKPCPGCEEGVQKSSGCNHMTCSRCKAQWCWLCSEGYKNGHYSAGQCAGLQFAKGDTVEEARENGSGSGSSSDSDDISTTTSTSSSSSSSSSPSSSSTSDSSVEDSSDPPSQTGGSDEDESTDSDDLPKKIASTIPSSSSSPIHTPSPLKKPKPSSSSSPTSSKTTSSGSSSHIARPSRIMVAGALALTIGTAGLAAPLYVRLRKRRNALAPHPSDLPIDQQMQQRSSSPSSPSPIPSSSSISTSITYYEADAPPPRRTRRTRPKTNRSPATRPSIPARRRNPRRRVANPEMPKQE